MGIYNERKMETILPSKLNTKQNPKKRTPHVGKITSHLIHKTQGPSSPSVQLAPILWGFPLFRYTESSPVKHQGSSKKKKNTGGGVVLPDPFFTSSFLFSSLLFSSPLFSSPLLSSLLFSSLVSFSPPAEYFCQSLERG